MRLSKISARYPKAAISAALFLTFLSLWAARRLKIENDLASLLPRRLASVRAMNELRETFGGLGHFMVVVESQNPGKGERFADRLEEDISALPEVNYVVHRRPVEYFRKRLWLYADTQDLLEVERRIDRALALEKRGISPVFNALMDFANNEDLIDLSFDDLVQKYRDRFGFGVKSEVATEDGTLRVLQVKLKSNPQSLDETKKLLAEFRRIETGLLAQEAFQGVMVGHTGSYQKMVEQADFTRKEILRVCAIVTVLLFLILLAYFRDPLSAFLVSMPVLIGVAWTGGVVALGLGHLNVITSFAAAILAGLGSDYGIYLLSRYRRERAQGSSFEEACRLTFSRTGRTTYLSMITTVGGFAALMFSRFSLFFEFGVVGAVGLALSWISMVLLLPAFLALEEGWRRKATGLSRPSPRSPGRILNFFVSRSAVRGVAVFGVLCLLAIGGLPFASKIHFDDGQVESRALPSYRLAERIESLFPLSTTPTVLLVKGQASERETVRAAQSLIESRPDAVFNHVLGLSTFIPEEQDAKRAILKRIRQKAESVERSFGAEKGDFISSVQSSIDASPVTRASLPVEVRRAFQSPVNDDVFAVTLNPSFGRVSAETMRRYREGVDAFQRESKLDFTAADNTFVSNDLIAMVEREAPRIFFLFLTFLITVLLLHVHPMKRALLIAASVLSGLLLLAGALRVFHIELNIINIAMLPVILGTAVDSFLHLSEALAGERPNRGEALKQEIPPIFVSNLTSVVGFGGLVLTSSSGIRSAGWVACLGILIVTVISTYIFPRMLALGRSPREPEGDAPEAVEA